MPALMFPHSHMSVTLIKKVLSFFGPINTFQPWFMEGPEFIHDLSIDISNPPDFLKPNNAFRSILSEYRRWMEQNRDKSYLEAFQASQDNGLTDNTTWEIRQMLNRSLGSLSGTEEEKSLRWHLILHLAREIVEQHVAADKLLKALKEKDALLKGSIENAGHIKNLLGDLSLFEQEPVLNDLNLGQILEAWLGLFGNYLKTDEILITVDSHIMDYISQKWDSLGFEERPETGSTITFKLPDISQQSLEIEDRIKRDHDIDQILKEMKSLIFKLDENPAHKLKALDGLSRELIESFPWKSPSGILRLTAKHLYPISGNGLHERDKIFEQLSHKTIILAGE